MAKHIKGENDLGTVRPDLAAEWHPHKNGDLTPGDVTLGSSKKVWWQCSEGHEWEAKIAYRSRGMGCPYCAGKTVLPGYTDLATVNPQLAAEWHPHKNGDLMPTDVTPGSGRRVWWRCSVCGHEWEAKIAYRNSGTGCPARRKHREGFSDNASMPTVWTLDSIQQHDLLQWIEKNCNLPAMTEDELIRRILLDVLAEQRKALIEADAALSEKWENSPSQSEKRKWILAEGQKIKAKIAKLDERIAAIQGE